MFKGNRKYYWLIAGLFLLMVIVQYAAPQPTDWRPTYMSQAKGARGCYALVKLLEGMSSSLETNTVTLYNLKQRQDSDATIYVMDNSLEFDEADGAAAFELLERGNNLVIAAADFSGSFFDSLEINTNYFFIPKLDDVISSKADTAVRFTASNLRDRKFKYSPRDYTNWFYDFDSSRFQIRGLVADTLPCVISARVGKGNLTLISCSEAFTNYMIVDSTRRDLAYALVSLNDTRHVIWDDYYKRYNRKGFNKTKESAFSFIFANDALYAGYVLMIFTLIAYMVFESRRTQRAIPVRDPITNTTLEFVNVISQVYYNSRNHSHIARERIQYFYENVRRKFGVQTTRPDEAMLKRISELSGCKYAAVRQLFAYTESLLKRDDVEEYDLIELNRQIFNFNKNSLR